MDFLSLSPYVQVLTVANFSYSGFKQIRNPLNDNFKKIPGILLYLDNTLNKIFKKQLVKSNAVSTILNLERIESESPVREHQQSMQANIENEKLFKIDARINKFGKQSNKAQAKEDKCYLFIKNLPSLYLMSGFYGVYLLIFSAVQNFYLDANKELPEYLSNSFFLFNLLISLFFLYIIISSFNVKKLKSPSPNFTLFFFSIFLFSFFYTTSHSEFLLPFSKLNDFNCVIISLILVSFPFAFHFLRQFQIKSYYQICILGLFIFAITNIFYLKLISWLFEKSILKSS